MVIFPTVDLPPNSFGTPQNRECPKLVDDNSNILPKATVAMAYFTRVGPVMEPPKEEDGGVEEIQLDFSPYK
jgi:hypothetical protein